MRVPSIVYFRESGNLDNDPCFICSSCADILVSPEHGSDTLFPMCRSHASEQADFKYGDIIYIESELCYTRAYSNDFYISNIVAMTPYTDFDNKRCVIERFDYYQPDLRKCMYKTYIQRQQEKQCLIKTENRSEALEQWYSFVREHING